MGEKDIFINLLIEYNLLIGNNLDKLNMRCDFNRVITSDKIADLDRIWDDLKIKITDTIKLNNREGMFFLESVIDDVYFYHNQINNICFTYHVPHNDFDTPEYSHRLLYVLSELLFLLKKHYFPLAYRKRLLYRIYEPRMYKTLIATPIFHLDYALSEREYEEVLNKLVRKTVQLKTKESLNTIKAAREVIKELYGFNYEPLAEIIRKRIYRDNLAIKNKKEPIKRPKITD